MRALVPLAVPHTIHSEDEFEEIVTQSPLPVLVDFWEPQCGAEVDPEVEKLARAKAGGAVIAKVNSSEIPKVAERLGVRGYPTFILFCQGRETKRIEGNLPAAELLMQMQTFGDREWSEAPPKW
jgi:thioredoxin-like negative regulator of GroEL